MPNLRCVSLLALVATLSTACSHQGTTPGASPAPPPSQPPAASEAPSSSPPPSLPPSGEYDVSVETTSDTCNPQPAVPFTQRLTIASHPRQDAAILNVPLVVGPPRVLDGGVAIPQGGMARSDIITTVGSTINNSMHPVQACTAYTEDTVLTVTEVSHDRVRLTRTRSYSDPSSCAPTAPRAPRRLANCRQEFSYTLTLVHSACELPCTGVIHPADGGYSLDCVCDGH